ncbi:UDP-N-acetylmuramoyl-L-alanine--D-glutamate ligase [Sediminibacter sp. Hel_I_10]|uniref:UDP-N-acetylmuramoyl-L-alanine--D-glutamate ligase n=1 Tax=Sediminibacter sp. Hel_I_10 TaxID=1392490 RepID=UPI00047E5BD1|nr:UDP-N-acetylmuramoyl-L-alanine--D-glutamate ligase [Sediminibacter sp. Hel_I_10]
MKRLVVLGGGESGVGAALLAVAKGFEVFVSDKGIIKEKYSNVLKHHGIAFESEMHSEEKILNADLVMKSPGIPDKAALIQKLKAQGVEIISEIELASRYTNAVLVGITGSNGKTTTSALTHHILKQELEVGLAGNIGDSFAKQILEKDYPNYVLEISSFQLDDIVDFKPHIAVLLNITPDHLDRYDYQFENYIASKFRIAENQTEDDYFIYDTDDEVIASWMETHPVKSRLLPFSLTKKVENGAYLEKEIIKITIDNNEIIMPTPNLALEGKHNIKNAMAASTVAHLLKIRKQTIRESLENFQGVEHRLEHVLKINKVQYINDSKATNVNATYYALESMETPTVWIVGGQDKGNNYRELFQFVNEKVKAIICLGVDNAKLFENFGNMVDVIVETQYMSEAVKIAYKIAESGDSVLLSPACASFDLFENYEDRGRQFKDAVRNL